MVVCDRWVAVKVLEVLMTIACLVCKRVTDDESVRLALFLQKISREWSLLRNITWDSIGASFGDAIYGGYVIITIALLFAKIFREIPRGRRILEGILLGFGALFFIILGGLELAALDSLPDGLIDNAAVLGTLSLITAALFLIDLGGPGRVGSSKHSHSQTDVERFNYPVLPNVNAEKRETRPERPDQNSGSLKPKFFPEKFKKADKKSTKKIDKKDLIVKEDDLPTVEFKPGSSGSRMIHSTDEVDKFISSQKQQDHGTMSDINNENVPDTKFDSLEITKYGSVRNGAHDREMFEKITPITRESKQFSSDDIDEKFKKYEEEMEKNVAYLKLLEERNMLKYQLEKKELEQKAAQYPRDYYDGKRNDDKKKYFFSSPSYDKSDKHWERFEAENLPRFPVREDYLPELQSPIITKLNQKPPNKGYGIYDNLTLYNINSKQADTQTDTLKSKTSTLKSKPLTLQQIAEYFGLPQKGKSNKREAAAQVEQDEMPIGPNLLPMYAIREDENINYNGGPSSPIDPGYVQYTARRWDDKLNKTSTRTPKHSPTGT